MGTTITTNHGLIIPDTDEKIQEDLPTYAGWAAQNEVNCDKIDALFRLTTHTWGLTWTASVNPTLGAGATFESKYIRLLPRLVICWFRIYVGAAGFLPGTGGYSLNIPVAMDPSIDAFQSEFPVGKAYFNDDSAAGTSSVFTVMYSTVGKNVFMRQQTNDLWSATSPVTVAQNDRLTGYFMYPTAVA